MDLTVTKPRPNTTDVAWSKLRQCLALRRSCARNRGEASSFGADSVALGRRFTFLRLRGHGAWPSRGLRVSRVDGGASRFGGRLSIGGACAGSGAWVRCVRIARCRIAPPDFPRELRQVTLQIDVCERNDNQRQHSDGVLAQEPLKLDGGQSLRQRAVGAARTAGSRRGGSNRARRQCRCG